ncbi:hypothetical protein [Comamonas sp. A7-5]|uniref:hypothetical protein n=1 Tax=Comamonas sp. A7-5 TaxID=673549 RepID=UPI0031E4951E
MKALAKVFNKSNVSIKYSLIDKESDNLFVFFNGAADRSKAYPHFQRISWASEFPGNCLYISDPLLEQNENISIGWYAGGRGYDVESAVDALILDVLRSRKLKKLFSWGSSAGGYASLRLAGRMENVTAVAINPQTDILKYHERHVNEYFQVAFPGEGGKGVAILENGENFNCLRPPVASSEYFLIQNVKDFFHYKNHYLPFLDLSREKNFSSQFKTWIYEDSAGHGPERKEMVSEILKELLVD